MANRIEYQIVGRYMDGKEVTGYHLQSIENGKSNRFTKEQVYFLVGRGQVSNCSGQLYQDKVLLRGVGMSLEDLPIQREDGTLTRTDSIGKVRKGTTPQDAMTQFMIVKSITDGRNTVGYIVANAGGATKNATRQQVFDLAKQGKIGNARYQESNGKPILRGVDLNLNELPSVTAESLGISIPKAPTVPTQSKSVAPVKKANTNEVLTSKDNEYIARFKQECTKAYTAVNNSSNVNKKLTSTGFEGLNTDTIGEDSLVVERFGFGLKNMPGTLGGFIELIRTDTNSYMIAFSYSADSDGDFITESFNANQMKAAIQEGWGIAVRAFKQKRII